MGAVARGWRARIAARPHLWAAVLLGLFVLAYLWPVLLGGRILSPIATLMDFPPWHFVAPAGYERYANRALVDLPLVDYPWRLLTRELVREGTFPAWNPYVFGGIPLYANPQTGLFSLFDLPLWILPLLYALGVTAALKLLAASIGTYLLARQLRLGFLPGLLAGVTFAFAAVNITWLAHETLLGVIVALPWALLLVERLLERARLPDALLLAIVIAVGLGGGHPGMQVHLLLLTSVYALLSAAFGPPRAPRLRALALVGVALALGTLLMAFMLVPEMRSSHETVGVASRQHGTTFPAARMPFGTIRSVLFPDWWGRSGAMHPDLTDANASVLIVNYNERTFYAGTVALLLAIVGLIGPGAWRHKAPFAIVGILGLAVALRAPGLYWLVTHLPVLRDVQPQRLHVAFALAVAVLSAYGLQALLDAPSRRRWLLVPLVATIVGVVSLVIAADRPEDLRQTVEHFLAGTDFAVQGVLAMTSVTWFLLFTIGVGALLVVARLRPGLRVTVAIGLVLLAVVDTRHFVHGYQPMGPEATVIPPKPPAIDYLERRRDRGRVVGLGFALPNDWPLTYGLRDVRGYDPPHPTQQLLDLWRQANPAQVDWISFTLPATLNRNVLNVLSVLGGRYVVSTPEVSLDDVEPRTLRTVYADYDATIAENKDAVPRAYVPEHVIVTGVGKTDERIAEAAFDPRTSVAVERDQPGVPDLASGPMHSTATVVDERNAGLTRSGVMRGVIVPAGRHKVEWRYAVPGLRLGIVLSLLALLVTCSMAVVSRRHMRADARQVASALL